MPAGSCAPSNTVPYYRQANVGFIQTIVKWLLSKCMSPNLLRCFMFSFSILYSFYCAFYGIFIVAFKTIMNDTLLSDFFLMQNTGICLVVVAYSVYNSTKENSSAGL